MHKHQIQICHRFSLWVSWYCYKINDEPILLKMEGGQVSRTVCVVNLNHKRDTNPNDWREKQGIWLTWPQCKALDPQMHVLATWHKPSLPNTLPEWLPMPTMFGNFRSQITLLSTPDLGFPPDHYTGVSWWLSTPAVTDFNVTNRCTDGHSPCFREEWDIEYDRKCILCDGVLDANGSQLVLWGVPYIHKRFYWQCLE